MSQPNGESTTTTPPTGGNDSATTINVNANPTQPAGQSNTAPEGTQSTAFSQADVDRIVTERLAREKAKFADYDQLKERASQWDKFVEESRPEQEKALDNARKEAEQSAYQKARSEFGGKLVQAHMQAAGAGRIGEAAMTALLAGVDTSRFLTETGDVDTAKVTSFIDGIAPANASPQKPGGFGQGPRSGAPKAGLESGAALWEERHKQGVIPPLFT